MKKNSKNINLQIYANFHLYKFIFNFLFKIYKLKTSHNIPEFFFQVL